MTRHQTVLGVDPGSKRIGVAIADLETRFARPLDVLVAGEAAIDEIVRLASINHATKIVVGKPVGLSGKAGPAVEVQQKFLEKLRAAAGGGGEGPIDVVEFDERLTTVVAEAGLRAGGAKAKTRAEIRDAVAAQVMLQGFLDSSA